MNQDFRLQQLLDNGSLKKGIRIVIPINNNTFNFTQAETGYKAQVLSTRDISVCACYFTGQIFSSNLMLVGEPSPFLLGLGGKAGCKNGPDIMHYMCKNVYGYAKKGILVRNLMRPDLRTCASTVKQSIKSGRSWIASRRVQHDSYKENYFLMTTDSTINRVPDSLDQVGCLMYSTDGSVNSFCNPIQPVYFLNINGRYILNEDPNSEGTFKLLIL